MGLAPSRMSANPALIPDSKTASTTSASASVSPEADSDSAFTNPTTITNPSGGQASAPVVLTQAKAAAVAEDAMSSAPKLDKGKGKQKAILEKEDGEISEEEEYRIPTGDSWRPPQHPKRDRSPQSFQSNSHQRRRSSQSFKPGYTSFGKKPRRDSRTALPHGAAAHPDRSSLSRSPDTTTNPLLTNKHDRRVSDVSRAASSSTSISPESNSLSLPDRVNPDEAEQYMDIIRNLIHDGIDPEVLIKRGATRKYVMAACEEIVAANKRSALRTEESGLVGADADVEMGDEVERILSPAQPPLQKLVASSSWSPLHSTRPAGPSHQTPPFRVETYKPAKPQASHVSPAPSSSAADQPRITSSSTSSHRSLPRPVSSYTPAAPGAISTGALPSAALAESSTTHDPLAPINLPSLALKVELEPSPSPTLISETLAERKKRVLESMKRGRKGSVPVSNPPTNAQTPQPTPPAAPSPPPILQPTPVPHSTAKLEDEVAALEREVMGMQDADAAAKALEEGEIVTSNEPSPVRPAQTLPVPAVPTISTATTLVNGVRPIRAKRRPQAEDLMDSKATSHRAAFPAYKRPFGRPVAQARLLINLDSDDEAETVKPARDTPPPNDAERAKLEEDIRILKEKIEQRRLAKLAKAKAGPLKGPSAVEVHQPGEESAQPADIEMANAQPDAVPATSVSSAQSPVSSTPLVSPPLVTPAERQNVYDLDTTPFEGPLFTPSPKVASEPQAVAPGLMDSFSAYRPLLDRYPQLPRPAGPRTSPLPQLDHRLISHTILTSVIARSPNSVVCGAEAAGGTCADTSCSDLHIGRVLGRVDDAALVEYLSQATRGEMDHAVLSQLLVRAKKLVGSDARPSLDSFSMSVAEQLVAKVGQLLQQQDQ